MGGSIDGHKNAAGGIIPFLKITNDIAVAVDQLGTRKGAIAVYIEPWHMDISDFIDLRKNSGEERRRAHELFPALWINDLFMKRVRANDKWTLLILQIQRICVIYMARLLKNAMKNMKKMKALPKKS